MADEPPAARKAFALASSYYFRCAVAAKAEGDSSMLRYYLEQTVAYGDAATSAGCYSHPADSARSYLARPTSLDLDVHGEIVFDDDRDWKCPQCDMPHCECEEY
jgi:hypothetical protein